MLDFYYYDDMISKDSYNIGILLHNYVANSDISNISSKSVRDVIESNVLNIASLHSITNKSTLTTSLQNVYAKNSNSFEINYENYINNEPLINSVKDIDLDGDISLSSAVIKNNIYSILNLSVGDNVEFDSAINLVFSDYEIGKNLSLIHISEPTRPY